jgi:uncharacterized protein YktB (UPF0637 family)
MPVKFTAADLQVFSIPDFKGRMAAIKAQVRPKLEALGQELGPLLMNAFKQDFFVHIAKHLRRTVNPPDETWFALGPEPRGYKAYVYFAGCIGKSGVQARVVMKDESALRPMLGENLIANQKFFAKHAAEWEGLADYTQRDKQDRPAAIAEPGAFAAEAGARLLRVKSARFEVGLPLKPLSATLTQDLAKAFDKLYPFYECGLKKGLKFK